MPIDNELDGTQPAPESETVENRDNAAPEQDNDQLDIDNGEGDEGQEAEGSGEQEGEGDKPAKPEKKKQPWELRRISELTAKQREAERRAAAAEAELERLRKKATDPAASADDPAPSAEEVRRQVREEIRADELNRSAAEQYQSRVNTWAESGIKEFGDDFNEKCNFVASFSGADRPEFMQTLTDPDVVEDGHKVVMALAEDPDEAERILALPPVKMAIALAKLSAKAAKTDTPAPKPISKAPAPVTPIGGRATAPSRIDDPDIPMDKFADEFLKTMAKRQH